MMAKTLIYDVPTKKLHIDPSRPLPIPDPTRNDHLIRVHATALCARELTWPVSFPEAIYSDNPEKLIVPGYDLAGTVITAPPNSPYSIGDEIYARTPASRPGNCREYTIARTNEMALKPKTLSWEDAATVPLSVLTAWQALFEHGGINGPNDANAKGKRVLVTAAAGGVGVWLVQLARVAGLDIVAQIGGLESDKFVRKLGAGDTINYRTTGLREWAEKQNQVDIVVDLVGGKTLEEAWYCVKDGGTLVSIFEPPQGRQPPGYSKKNIKSLFFIMEPNGNQLSQVSNLIEEGKCRPVLDSTWTLEEYEQAFERLDQGHAKGKIVIQITT
ncbi:MAG: hypothetical protein M1825_004806 [Sarcosagium campestre]|nr:MAG: hypothetical protein M1825_004806 [Sarcosagium campestre]